MKCHSKNFVFPKIAFCSSRKVNQPEVEMELRYTEKGPVLSICGSIWNSKHTDIVMGGQCLDEMMKIDELANNSLFKRLHRLWSLWHLNGMHAGTEAQENALDDAKKSGVKICSYDDSDSSFNYKQQNGN
jgi:hypothetical protein